MKDISFRHISFSATRPELISRQAFRNFQKGREGFAGELQSSDHLHEIIIASFWWPKSETGRYDKGG